MWCSTSSVVLTDDVNQRLVTWEFAPAGHVSILRTTNTFLSFADAAADPDTAGTVSVVSQLALVALPSLTAPTSANEP